jgi:uncharacterized repeat protein (TIGR01451 family)
MKKNLLTLLFILSISLTSRAQYVAIPDTAFGNSLNILMPTCMSGNATVGWMLDTVCAAIRPDTIINISLNVKDMTGLQFCKNLLYLDCFHMDHLTNIPAFPPNAKVIEMIQCPAIRTLPSFPSSITSLDLYLDSLQAIPALPISLSRFVMNAKFVSSISALPSGLIDIGLNCSILSLPRLPDSLQYLTITAPISQLPSLPQGLKYIIISAPITQWPASFPPRMTQLGATNCIKSIPPHLNEGLVNVTADFDFFYSFPNSLRSLSIDDTVISSLPDFPDTLYSFQCHCLNLKCLPYLRHLGTPPSWNNPGGWDVNSYYSLQCVPNVPEFLSYTDPSAATGGGFWYYYISNQKICGMYNPNGCQSTANVNGQTFEDQNRNCIQDSTDRNVSNIRLDLYQNGILYQSTFSLSNGMYSFKTDTGRYIVHADTAPIGLRLVCPHNIHVGDSTHITPADSSVFDLNFGYECIPGYDLSSDILWGRFRPGSTRPLITHAGDITQYYGQSCAGHMGGYVRLILSGPGHYDSPYLTALTPTSVVGDTITWTVADFSAIDNNRSFVINVKVDSNASTTDLLCVNLEIGPMAGDNDPYNNIQSKCIAISNSFDPNQKEVWPVSNISTNQEWMTYTIHFQNTGTDTAINIHIADTIDAVHLDFNSLTYLGSSSTCITQMTKPSIVNFIFPNINLPDSMQNSQASSGWVTYKVKIKPNLPLNTQIKNTASIYFDLNPAVRTNTTVNTVSLHTGIETASETAIMHLYPNPNSGSFTLETANQIGQTYIITDMLGQIVLEKTITSDKQHIDISTSAPGIYTLMLRGKSGAVRVVVR